MAVGDRNIIGLVELLRGMMYRFHDTDGWTTDYIYSLVNVFREKLKTKDYQSIKAAVQGWDGEIASYPGKWVAPESVAKWLRRVK
jgi:hypothetical protein